MANTDKGKRQISVKARERLLTKMLLFGERQTAAAIGLNVQTCQRAAAGLYLHRAHADLIECLFGAPGKDETTS